MPELPINVVSVADIAIATLPVSPHPWCVAGLSVPADRR